MLEFFTWIYDHTSSLEKVFGGTAGIGGLLFMLKKLPFSLSLSIGNKKGNNSQVIFEDCPVPKCKTEHNQMVSDIGKIREELSDKIWPKLDKMSEDISFIAGWVEGQKQSQGG